MEDSYRNAAMLDQRPFPQGKYGEKRKQSLRELREVGFIYSLKEDC